MELRSVSATVAAVALVVLAGCSGGLTGGGELTFTASQATISDEALSKTGYEAQPDGVKMTSINQTFEVAGQERQVTMSTSVAIYQKDFQQAPLAFAVVLAFPSVSVLDQSVNPLGNVGEQELVKRALSRGKDVQELTKVETKSATILGEKRDVTKYQATSENSAGNSFVYFVQFQHGGDYIVAAIEFPSAMENGDADAMTLVKGIQH
jgi:hypothetical protein